MSSFKLDPLKKINNNGATVINGGNISQNNPVTKNLALKDLGVTQNLGSTVKEISATDNGTSQPYGVQMANSGVGYVFAYDQGKYNERSVLARGIGAAGTKINRVESNFLNRTASEYAGVPRFKSNVIQGSKVVDGDHWLMPPPPSGGGQIHPGFQPNPLRGSGYLFEDGTGGVAADKNVTANRSVPGEITFRTGSPVPQTKNLKARDASEGVGP
jgi:hypothetical protein